VWSDDAPGLRASVAYTTDADARAVLEPLRPPPPPPEGDNRIFKPIPPPPPGPPWWKKSWVREAAAIGAIVVVGGIATYAATRDPGSSMVVDHVMWKP